LWIWPTTTGGITRPEPGKPMPTPPPKPAATPRPPA